jgi:DNA polymerase
LNNQNKLTKLEILNRRILACKRCELYKTRKQPVTGEGNPNSVLMIIAQAPGYLEDKEGRMFIGPSGKKLNEILKHVKINKKNIYMTNLVKCFPP